MKLRRVAQKGRGIVIPAVVVAVWWLAAESGWVSPYLLPPPEKVIATLLTMLQEGRIIDNLALSLGKVLKGFLLGTGAGFALGVMMGLSATLEKLIAPLFNGIRQVPVLGWIPILILLFGLSELAKVVFIALGAFYPMALNTFDGCRQLKKEYLEVARVFQYGRIGQMWRFTLPSAVPSILAGIRSSLSEAWLLVIGAEIFFKTAGGIGDMMWEAKEKVRMDVVFITILVVGLVGYVLNQGIGLLEGRLLRWRGDN
ncbi:MAG TPA: ABC transporter permease [Desulfuromonadaceae bacterium]